MMSAINATNIHLKFDGKVILDGADFAVEQGDRVCIWGPSGGGKSTFLRVLAGLEKADQGHVFINGKPAEMDSPKATDPVRNDLGFVFQNSALISNLNVFDNVAMPLRYHRFGTEDVIKQRVEVVLQNMLVAEHAHEFPHQLSLGIQKRVAVARTLILDPTILLMDEPTAGLDFINRVNLLALLWNVSQLRKVTVIMVTHDLEIPRELGTSVSILANGRITSPLPVEELHTLKGDFMDELLEELGAHDITIR